MFTIKPESKKILGEIVLCKVVEGFFILLAAAALIKFINSPSEKFLLATFGLFAVRFILSGMTERLFARLSVNVQTSFRNSIHEQIFIKETQSGELLTLIFDTVQSLDDFFLKVAPQIASAIVFLPIFFICAAFTDLLTAGILLVTLPIAPLLLWLIGKATAEKNARAWAELQKLNADFRELLSAITTLKMFGRIDAGAKKIHEASQKSSAATLDVLKLAFVSSFALELITTLSIALVAVTLGLRLVAGSVEFQAALFLLLLAPEFFLPIRKFGVAFHVMISARESLARLKTFLVHADKVVGSAGKILMPPSISFVDVTFTYPKKKSPVLSGLNLKFSAGKVTALIGDSGAGKSTVLKLLAGLLTPTAGEIFWNDLPTSRMEKISMLSKVSYVPQAPHLFDAPLIKNFTMFDTLDAAELKILLAELNLPLDLNSTQKLSRGQLQRLGLIRAILKNSPIILLDEPTAGLDELTEQKVINLIKKISPRRTIIIATHRLAVINAADEVIQL
ncbi:MAG: ATP-binding cassette domain-containing protein [Selenomonadaceae bacterium]|nr:ATP-binding cassette domain-containing protein [Selenomonadaceae bacterium]